MATNPIDDLVTDSEKAEAAAVPAEPVSLLRLGAALFRIGATTFGGMWAATQKLEDELVHRRRWLTLEEQQALMVAATLIPAPKFLSFGGMVGFRLRGWLGSIVALFSLVAPAAIFVLLGAIFLNPDVVGAPLVPVRRAVGIAIVGLLFGNAYHQLKGAKVSGRKKLIGILLALSVAVAAIAGVPLVVAAVAGFAIGALLIRKD
jgi:chromate transporter